MPELVATPPGLFPLPDPAKEDLADLKGHQKHDLVSGDEGDDVTAVYDRARSEVVETQRTAGVDRVVEGQLRWDDMLAHPLAVHDAVETRGIVRYYDNNNFYREPVVVGDLAPDGDVAADLARAADLLDAGDPPLQAVLPGPYSLADLATDEHYGDGAFLDAVAGFLAGEVAEFPDVETLFLLEPSLVTDPPGDGAGGAGGRAASEAGETATAAGETTTGAGDPAAAADAVDRVAAAADADVVVHAPWGALDETVHAHLVDAGVDAVGYDLVTAPEDNLHNAREYGTTDDVALGLVDGQNTRVESPGTVRERVDWFVEQVPQSLDTVYVTANTGLFYLPVDVFETKLETLGAAAAVEEVEA